MAPGPPPSHTSAHRSPDPATYTPALALLILTAIAYLPAFQAGFIWDDDDYIIENQTLRDWNGLRRIWFEPRATPQYYPLVHTTFWIEYHLWELWAPGYHATNVLLHGMSAALVWLILRRLSVRGAWLAAALFALHPVHVESVAWVTERKNVLSAVLGLGALRTILEFTLAEHPESNTKTSLRNGWWIYALATGLFVAALLSKTVVCSLPIVVLLLVWLRRGRVTSGQVMSMIPWLVVGAVSGLMTAFLERVHVGASGQLFELSCSQRVIIAGRAVWFYWSKLLWPFRLMFMYPRWEPGEFDLLDWAAPVGVVLVVLTFWLLRHRYGRGPFVAVAAFLVSIFPALGFVNIYPMRYSFVADHFQYLASIGPLAMVASLSTWLAVRGTRDRGMPRSAIALISVALLGLVVLTWRQSMIYHDEESLWTDVLSKNPRCFAAHFHLGKVRVAQEKHTDATRLFAEALRLQTDETEADIIETLLANSLTREERADEARPHFEEALRRNPFNFEALLGLGNFWARRTRTDVAIPLYRRALDIHPESAIAHFNLGNALAVAGDIDAAVASYEMSLKLDPSSVVAHINLGNAMARLGRLQQAEQHYRAALRLDPASTTARQLLARVRAEQSRP